MQILANSRRGVSVAVVALTFAAASVARADDDGLPPSVSRSNGESSFAALSEQGLALYRARDYHRALEKFLQAYTIEHDPNLLFNIGRCYESLGSPGFAIEKYEAYLESPGIDPKGKERAERQLRALRKPADPKTPADESRALRAERREHGGASTVPMVIGWMTTAVLFASSAASGIMAMDSASKLKAAREAFPADGDDIARRASQTTALTVAADALGLAAVVMGSVSLYWTVKSSTTAVEVKAAVGPNGVKLSGSF